MKHIHSIAFFLVALLLLGGCASTTSVNKYNSSPLSAGIPAGVTQEQVYEAMTRTFVGRDWQVVAHTRTSVTGKIVHKNYNTEVKMENLGNTVVLYSVKSEKTTTVDGQPSAVQDVPVEWLQNLQKDLVYRLQSYVAPIAQ